MASERYQIVLIFLGVIATIFFGVFLWREIFPEYKIYQKKFVELEQFRSSYTGEPPEAFQYGIKQIVLEKPGHAPPIVDRCTSCHVAIDIPDYSPLTPAKDEKGNIQFDSNGFAIQVPNDRYVFSKLDAAIKQEQDPAKKQSLEALKRVNDDGFVYDIKKVLVAHPLMGGETHPFQYHPQEEYGCTSCHGGNGRGLTVQKAHGPIWDEKYDIEFTGPTPTFTEQDPQHDPPFSKMFNNKPGDALIFQTTPILPSTLLQANCLQCHDTARSQLKNAEFIAQQVQGLSFQSFDHQNAHSPRDLLIKNYERGKELFMVEACYACHRIAGLSRGGVGPELTYEGDNAPWFVKQSIVWPQADLKTSTMPNFRLDHPELQDLVTFLLGQKGTSEVKSGTFYKSYLQKWDAGQKNPWEEPIPPQKIEDIRFAQTVFAEEGCAACHRLRGFDSEVGFVTEKEGKDLKDRSWFEKLFPEGILGSDLAKVLVSHAKEIDQKIVHQAKKEGIIEEIEKKNPGLLITFYTPFGFASRVHEDSAYQDRLSRVLKQYIQIYGFGRLICPRPNWSGVYRSDEWLMEHFRKPGVHVPKSIMPVFPFDDTKFYALTHMLDVLGIRNQDQDLLRQKVEGFNPAKAFEIHCSQCHGDARQGNGPVSEWIYPIPKNLSNPDFLRNLTKERALQSILYGIPGTPMPPWGQTPKGGTPILSIQQAQAIVDWLFSFLPGEKGLAISKWDYLPKDVMEELKDEGTPLPFVFTIEKPLMEGPDKKSYFIKKSLYSPENIAEGKAFFEVNCAPCHGVEADGSGLRSEAMQEAKPMMLTNLDWLSSRDDLRLLRSIKFGIGGTAMTPWGDQTSALQRLQLVMFIRSLILKDEKLKKLTDAIYQAFDIPALLIDSARVPTSQKIAEKEEEIKTFQRQENQGELTLDGFKEKQKALQTLSQLKKIDDQWLQVKKIVAEEATKWQGLGRSVIEAHFDNDPLITAYLNLVLENKNHFQVEGDQLKWQDVSKKDRTSFLNFLQGKQREDAEKTFNAIDQLETKEKGLL